MVQPIDLGPCAFWKSTGVSASRQTAGGKQLGRRNVLPRHRRAAMRLRQAVAWGLASVAFTASVVAGGVAARHMQRGTIAALSAPLAVPLRVRMTIHRGDSLWSLARRYGNPDTYILDRVDSLAAANDLSVTAHLVPGQRILVPVSNPVEVAKLQQYWAKN